MNSKQFESLHTHTTLSDGQFTHLEVLNLAQKYKIGTVAFTDHDILPDKKILRILEQNRDHQTKWIIGCELTSALPKELDKKSGGHHLHILGLFLDPYNKDLNLYCQNLLESRVVRMKKMINYLKDLGFAISFEACRKISQGAVARPHLVEALRLKEKNSKIIDLWVEKIIKKSEHDASAKKIYDKLLKQEKINCVYEFLNANAYAQEEDKKNSALLDLDGAVSLIRGAGGIASLAHWTFSKNFLRLKEIEKLLKENRLDGAEIVFGRACDQKIKKEINEDLRLIKDLVAQYHKIPTGGPDMHSEEDFAYLISQKLLARRTIGLTQNIIDKTKVDLKFSSLN